MGMEDTPFKNTRNSRFILKNLDINAFTNINHAEEFNYISNP
jgi:hypothetical protein